MIASARADGDIRAPVRLKHLSAHPEIDPQLPVELLAQDVPCGQQSDCVAERDACGETVRAKAPATGSMATESATTATRMARIVLMAQGPHYLPTPLKVKSRRV